jgi:hypothetical protein
MFERRYFHVCDAAVGTVVAAQPAGGGAPQSVRHAARCRAAGFKAPRLCRQHAKRKALLLPRRDTRRFARVARRLRVAQRRVAVRTPLRFTSMPRRVAAIHHATRSKRLLLYAYAPEGAMFCRKRAEFYACRQMPMLAAAFRNIRLLIRARNQTRLRAFC